MLDTLLQQISENKYGCEIGGPTNIAEIIYKHSINMDNVVFQIDTTWHSHSQEYNYYKDKKGKVIINDSVDIHHVASTHYDFVFSSHTLEHIANPLKAIREWLRIIKPCGHIIMIVPEKSECFDHKREYSKFSTLLTQYEKNVGEDDLSTLPDILRFHDLRRDPWAGSFENFTKRSLDNYHNRCLHHYVYNDDLLMEICNFFKCEFIYTETSGVNRWFMMKKLC